MRDLGVGRLPRIGGDRDMMGFQAVGVDQEER